MVEDFPVNSHWLWAATWQNKQNEFAPSEDSDKPGHPPSLIRVFAVRSVGSWGPKLSSCGQRRLWSDWADAQADLSLRWAHSYIVGFVMSRLLCVLYRRNITPMVCKSYFQRSCLVEDMSILSIVSKKPTKTVCLIFVDFPQNHVI